MTLPRSRRGGLTGEAAVLAMADGMRSRGTQSPASLFGACAAAFGRGEIPFDRVTPLYRHACLHAGIVLPVDRERFEVCPECCAVFGGSVAG